MVGQSPDTIKALEEILRSLRITEENVSNKNTELVISETSEEISTTSAVYNKTAQAVMPKSMVSDPGWFNKNRTKFEDW